MKISSKLATNSNFNIGCKIIATAGVHYCDTDLKNNYPYQYNKNNNSSDVGSCYEFDYENNYESQNRKNAHYSILYYTDIQIVTKHLFTVLNFYKSEKL